MKTHLSGMPECRFGFTNNCILLNSENLQANPGDVILEHSKFHQCVQLNKFDSHRIIQFVPPDGEFQLMSYQCKQNVNLPFKIVPQISIGSDKVTYKIKIKSYFPEKLVATNVQVKIPTPVGVIDHDFSNSGGKCKFLPQDNTILWKFNKFNGNREYILTADVSMTSRSNEQTSLNWTRPPIKLDFVLDMLSCSGLTVKFLKVMEKSNYRTVKWVRYQSQSGSYEFRY
jgi:AP-2 complex subunit mu-1